jgi:superfamily II RNA helicase
MSRIDARLVRSIENVLEKECALQLEYIKVLAEERDSLTRFKSETVEKLCARREELCEAIEAARDQRMSLMRELPEGDSLKLTEIVNKYIQGSDAKRILALSERLKDLVRNSTQLSREFNQVVNFSINLLNGAISTIYSISHAARSYSSTGAAKTNLNNEARSVITRQA